MTAKPIALDAVVAAPPPRAWGHGVGRSVVEPPRPVGEQRHSPRELGARPWRHLSRVTPPEIRRRP